MAHETIREALKTFDAAWSQGGVEVGTVLGTVILTLLFCHIAVETTHYLSSVHFSWYRDLSHDNQEDFDMRVISTVHSFTITLLVALQYAYTPLFDHSVGGPLMLKTHALARLTMGISMGYFIYDTLRSIVLEPWYKDIGMLIHHAVSGWTVYYAISFPFGHLYMMWVLASEVTTPFINMKFIFEYMGLKSSPLYSINGLIIFLGWIVGRLALFALYFIHVGSNWHETRILTPTGIVVLVVLPSIISCLNVYWFMKIARGIFKHFIKPKKAKGEEPKKEQ